MKHSIYTKSNKWNENVISFLVGQKFMFSKMYITCIIYIKLEKEHLKKGDGKVRKHKLNEIISKITYVYTCNWITLLCTGNVVSQLYFSKIYTLRKKSCLFISLFLVATPFLSLSFSKVSSSTGPYYLQFCSFVLSWKPLSQAVISSSSGKLFLFRYTQPPHC